MVGLGWGGELSSQSQFPENKKAVFEVSGNIAHRHISYSQIVHCKCSCLVLIHFTPMNASKG